MIKKFCWKHPVFVAAIFAFVCTVIINYPSLKLLATGQLSLQYLSGNTVDETYYFAMIRSVAAGNAILGNVSLKEHRLDTIAPGYGPLFQGLLIKIFGISLSMAILIGDIFFTFLCIFLVWGVVWKIFHSYIKTIIVSWWIVSIIGFHLLRSISPQVTYIAFICYLFLFFSTQRNWKILSIRGLLIMIEFFIHPILAIYLAACDCCDAIYQAWNIRSYRYFFTRSVLALGSLLLAGFFKFMLPLQHGSKLEIADTYRRLGTIPSHLPAAPILQIKLLLALVALFFVIQRGQKILRITALRLLLCTIAGLLVLNQSIIHGVDVIFGLYYNEPLEIILWLVVAFLLLQVLPSRSIRYCILCGACIFSTYSLFSTVLFLHKNAVMPHPDSLSEVIDWVRTQPSSIVIAAPEPIANLLPVENSQYVLFNAYSVFQVASDSELAERFIAQRSIFTTPIDRTYGNVLGLYAGNVAARKRTLCQIISFLTRAKNQCPINIRQAIYHQDVLKMLDSKPASILPLLQKYSTNYILSDQSIPLDVLAVCPFQRFIGRYSLYACRQFSK